MAETRRQELIDLESDFRDQFAHGSLHDRVSTAGFANEDLPLVHGKFNGTVEDSSNHQVSIAVGCLFGWIHVCRVIEASKISVKHRIRPDRLLGEDIAGGNRDWNPF